LVPLAAWRDVLLRIGGPRGALEGPFPPPFLAARRPAPALLSNRLIRSERTEEVLPDRKPLHVIAGQLFSGR
ncbi:MAG TPA: hypothetical protein VMK12_27950, partial [Anaeromyxobacteraceae bacterium]|nr:hypothetical protein [Anaeromyxobacteraceae bacterium]